MKETYMQMPKWLNMTMNYEEYKYVGVGRKRKARETVQKEKIFTLT
jgi:hypothetical protein